MLSIRRVMFIVCWAYAEWGLSYAQHTRSEVYRMLSIRGVGLHVHLVFLFILCWAYVEWGLSYAEHTQSKVYRMLSIRRVRFIVCWAYAEWGLLYAEHTRSEVYRMLSIRRVRLIYAEHTLIEVNRRLSKVYCMLSIRRVKLHAHLVFFVHFMPSICVVRYIVCWAYVEWDLLYAEYTRSLHKHIFWANSEQNFSSFFYSLFL